MDNFTRSVIYDVVNQISLVNNGTVAASPIYLIVALIPCIAPYQKVISMEFDSQYAESFSDAYGNRYAKFKYMTDLSPGSRISIQIKYQVEVMGQYFDLSQHKGMLLNDFTNEERYIESDAKLIIDHAKRLAQDKSSICEKSEAFYNFVADNMRYAGYDPNDMGALMALKYLSGDCVEYSDLLVALNRAVGIPARTVDGLTGCTDQGYDAGNNKHCWLEVHFPGIGWVPVDPTWGRYPQDRATYFGNMTPDHIVVTRGRNLIPLNPLPNTNNHYYAYRYWWNGKIKAELKSEERWSILEHR
ncbi:MAG: transglutaminase domain-containing protein [Methanothrix sp.]|nr:transglutaminase domain-containing protein [Methanothrix sp.]